MKLVLAIGLCFERKDLSSPFYTRVLVLTDKEFGED